MALRLIVHADDLGISESVNDGIRKAHLDGILTSASIMPSGAAFSDAVLQLRSLPDLDLGIHLTLVEERPLSPVDSISTLVDDTGRFHAHAEVFAREFVRGRIDGRQLAQELEAQIARVMESGLKISHIDTHQHLHAFPSVRDIVVTLAHKYGITRIRRPVERLKPYMFSDLGNIKRVLQLVVLNILCFAGQWGRMQYTDHFAGFYFGGRLSLENLRIVLESLPRQGTCELMCHPGDDGSSANHEHWEYSWREELAALVDADVRELVHRMNIELVSYKDINPS